MRPMNSRSAPKLTLWPGVGLVAANMIGAGVFLSAGFMAQEMGPGPILVAWVVGAVLALAGARAYAELARLVPRSGGEYRYLSDLLHPSLGFLAGWASLLVGFSAPVAVDALAAGAFAKTVFPALSPAWTAAAFIVALTALHAVGLRTSERAQNILIGLKVLLLAGFVIVGLAYGQHSWPTWTPPSGGSGYPWAATFQNLFYIAFAFSGWNAAVYAAEEFEQPDRTVPRAMLVGCLLVAGLYLVVNWIFVANLAPKDAFSTVLSYVTGSEQVTLANAVVGRLLGPGLGKVMSLFTVAVFLSAMSAMTFIGPRVYAAMAKDGFLPAALAGKDGKPPVGSLLLQAAVALLIVFTQSLKDVLGNVGAILTFFAALSTAGLFRAALRKDGPKVRPGALVAAAVYVLTAAYLIGFDLYKQKGKAGWIVPLVLVGLVAYAVARARRRSAAAPGAAASGT